MIEKRILKNQIVIMRALLLQTEEDKERSDLVTAIHETEKMIEESNNESEV